MFIFKLVKYWENKIEIWSQLIIPYLCSAQKASSFKANYMVENFNHEKRHYPGKMFLAKKFSAFRFETQT